MPLLALASAAHAQVEVCAAPLSLTEWREQMDAVDGALRELDGARADVVLDDLVYELRCLSEPATPDAVGRLARQVALVAFFAQDLDELSYWGLLAREAAGGMPWPEGVPVPVRFEELVGALPEAEVDRVEGQGLLVPKGGGALLDGRLLGEPAATRGAQHLLQVADKKGAVVWTRWQTGAGFPEDVLAPGPTDPGVPRWYVAPPDPVPVHVPEPVAVAPVPEQTVTFGDPRWVCPWEGIPADVEAHGASVTVAGAVYRVKTDEEVVAFRKTLRGCGEFRAARRFLKWQAARGKPFAGARGHRDAMVEALLTPEPKGRKRRPPPEHAPSDPPLR